MMRQQLLIQSIPSSLNIFLPKEWNNYWVRSGMDDNKKKSSSRSSITDPNYGELHYFLYYQSQAVLISFPQPVQWNVPEGGCLISDEACCNICCANPRSSDMPWHWRKKPSVKLTARLDISNTGKCFFPLLHRDGKRRECHCTSLQRI